MSAPNCLRGLGLGLGLTRPVALRNVAVTAAPCAAAAAAASFSTSAYLQAIIARPKKKAVEVAFGHHRAGKKMKLSKFKKANKGDRGKAPAPGERKAYRKRILLSNNNAIPVAGLQDFAPETMLDPSSAAKVLSIPDAVVDQLRTIEAFKTTQSWSIFRKPSMLVRAETVELATRMQGAAANKQALRLVATGDKLTGKSMLLLQAMTHGLLNDWIVLNIPEGQELTTASTEYAAIPGTANPVQYMQQNYALRLIQNFRKANEKVLVRLMTVFAHPELPQNIPVNSPLLQLANSAKEPENAWPIFQALWKELMAPGRGRPPVLFTLDGLPHIMKVSDYRSATFEPVHAHDLALVRLFSDCLSGAVAFPNGGAVIAATTRSNGPRTPSMELALAQREAEQSKSVVPAPEAFVKYDERVAAALRTVQVMRLKGVSKLEARSLMEYWAASGVFRTTVDEAVVTEKWTLGGSGILGEIERAALMTMRL
ncbi:mitochondrial ribosomal protein [Bombardia bombarda]|uniref:Small ribosomal subunit protein mS29 n=1 Tax=Bombardia bombarda TaxID=252184 RepID=A0AA39WZV5_9PEZI|nr:mitochondrial ribosomal protein [Bombardia bombarda]